MEDLITARLLIRPFAGADLARIHRILHSAFEEPGDVESTESLAERRSWLEWSILGSHWLPAMHQPPYGDRAIVVRDTGELIGAAGYVPLLMPFDQITELARIPQAPSDRVTPEVGLFGAIDPRHQRQGFATEAGAALIEHAFTRLQLWRILATTTYDNLASQAVMRKLGMTLTRNPLPDPPWMQVVGVRYSE